MKIEGSVNSTYIAIGTNKTNIFLKEKYGYLANPEVTRVAANTSIERSVLEVQSAETALWIACYSVCRTTHPLFQYQVQDSKWHENARPGCIIEAQVSIPITMHHASWMNPVYSLAGCIKWLHLVVHVLAHRTELQRWCQTTSFTTMHTLDTMQHDETVCWTSMLHGQYWWSSACSQRGTARASRCYSRRHCFNQLKGVMTQSVVEIFRSCVPHS